MKKNFSFKAFFITAKAFVKKNVLSCLCLLLATLVAITGSISYSKYISTSPINKNPGAGSFTASASIDGISALSFTNTAFWGGTVEDDKIAMNALRSVDFSVKNYQIDSNSNKKVADVKMKYNLIFIAPVNFAERLAMQVFNSEDQPMLPQIVLGDLIDSAEKGAVYNTANNTDDYNSASCDPISFNTQFGISLDDFITVSAISDKAVIRLEEFEREVHQSLLFRMWDTSALTSVTSPVLDTEGGKLLPPLTVNYKQIVNFYRITISMPEFVLPAGVETVVDHSIQLAPTNTIQDLHLGGEFVESKSNPVHVTSIYGPDGVSDEKLWTLQTVHEVQTDLYYSGFNEGNNTFSNPIIEGLAQKQDRSEYNIMGSPKVYHVGEIDEKNTDSYTKVDEEVDGEWSDWSTPQISTITENKIETPALNGTPTSASWNNPYKTSNEKINIQGVSNTQYVKVFQFEIQKSKNVTEVKEITRRRKISTSTETETRISELTETLEISEIIKPNIVQKIKRTITTKKTIVDNYEVETKKVTVTKDFIYTGNYFIAYYRQNRQPSANNNGTRLAAGTITIDGKDYELGTVKNWELQDSELLITDSSGEEISQSFETVSGDVSTSLTEEYIKRTIDRSFNYDDITIESVTWQQRDAAGNPKYDSNNKPIVDTYVHNKNPLTFFKEETGTDTNGDTITANVQKLYLSQCYSKNYPFYVNVVFEQVLE